VLDIALGDYLFGSLHHSRHPLPFVVQLVHLEQRDAPGNQASCCSSTSTLFHRGYIGVNDQQLARTSP
jgi:hypothetical protein